MELNSRKYSYMLAKTLWAAFYLFVCLFIGGGAVSSY